MSTAITELFGTNVFSVSVMRERLPKKVFAEVTNVMENGGSISMSTADVVALSLIHISSDRWRWTWGSPPSFPRSPSL